jgi:hypothetical protein
MFTHNRALLDSSNQLGREQYRRKAIALSEEEKAYATKINRIIYEGCSAEHRELSKNVLTTLDSESIFKLCKHSALFEDFCKRKDLPHYEAWTKELQVHGRCGRDIEALDGDETYSIHDQYVGIFADAQLAKALAAKTQSEITQEFWLDEACLYKSFYGLKERAEWNKEKLLRLLGGDLDVMTKIKNQMTADLNLMVNLYMTMGYFAAASFYFRLAITYDKMKMDEMYPVAVMLYQQAAGDFFRGKALLQRHLPEDMHMIKIMGRGGDGLKIFGFATLTDAEALIATHLDQAVTTLEINAEHEVTDILALRTRHLEAHPKMSHGLS